MLNLELREKTRHRTVNSFLTWGGVRRIRDLWVNQLPFPLIDSRSRIKTDPSTRKQLTASTNLLSSTGPRHLKPV